MPRIDTSRVVGKDEEELRELTCGICHGLFSDPTDTQCCRQTYCNDCITEWLAANNSCPNDRKPLTTDGLKQSARLVVNLIDKLKIECKFSAKGCPSVHTIAQDRDHLNVCEFARCQRCGLSAADTGHDCVSHLLNRTRDLANDNHKLKRQITDLMASEVAIKERNKKLKSYLNESREEVKTLNDKINQLKTQVIQKPDIAPSLSVAIMNAKGKTGSVMKRIKIHDSWEEVAIDICKDVINDFDDTEHNYKDVVHQIETKLGERSKWPDAQWTWSVFLCEKGQERDSKHFDYTYYIIVIIGNLSIVLSHN